MNELEKWVTGNHSETKETTSKDDRTRKVDLSEPVKPFSARNFLAHHDTHPLILDELILKHFGIEALTWEGETLREELKKTFKQGTISNLNWEMIQATRTCRVTSSPWRAWEVFLLVCQALNNNIPDFQVLQKPTPAQILNALTIMKYLDNHALTEEVEQFIAAAFLDEGIFYLPPPANVAQEWASEPRYVCSKCGKVDLDYDNNMCDSCGAPQKYLEKVFARDYRPVEQRYNQCVLLGRNRDVLQENWVDVQVAKLLVARDYVLQRQLEHKAQKEILKNAGLL